MTCRLCGLPTPAGDDAGLCTTHGGVEAHLAEFVAAWAATYGEVAA